MFLSEESVQRGRDWYDATYFAHAGAERVLGEKSTSYIEVPQAAERVRQVLGEDTRIVALLRDPVSRAVSNWRFSTDHGKEARPVESALRANLAEPTPWDPCATSVSPFAYLERGRYAEHLTPWFEAFSTHVHVLFLHDLLEDRETLAGLYTALGVDPDFSPAGRDRPLNESSEPAAVVPADLVTSMRDYFADSDEALRRRLGRTLPWRSGPGSATRAT